MSHFGNYDDPSQQPKNARPGSAIDSRYIYASRSGWTLRHFKNQVGSTFYDEVIVACALYTDDTLATRVTRALNGSGAGYPSKNGVYRLEDLGGVLTGYSAGVKNLTGGSGTGATATVTIGYSLTISAAGTGYTDGTKTVTGGTGTGLTVAITTTEGAITGATIVNPGTGYASGDVLTVVGGTDGTVTVVTTLTSAVITAYGKDYADGETLTIAGGSATVKARV